MRLFVIFGVFFTVVSTAVGQEKYKFDCNRLPNSCKNAGTCKSKECVCIGDWTGYNCNHPAAATACSTDPVIPNPCKSGGTCYKSSDETQALCYCKYGYYGDTCEEEIAKINCSGNTAEYSLSFPAEFSGKVVLVDENGTSLETACQLVQTDSGRKTYALTVDITDDGTQATAPCKMENIIVDDKTQPTYQANLRVFYNPSLITNIDEDYILNCTHTTEDVEVSLDIESVIINNDNFDQVNANETYLPVVFEVRDENDTDIGNELVLGERTWLNLYTRPGSEYAGCLFESCTANNYLTNENETMSIKFLDKGCPTADGNFINAIQVTKTKTITTEQGDITVDVKATVISAFKFSNSDKVQVQCKAKVCKTGDSSCDLPNCTAIMNEDSSDGGGNTTGNTTNGGGDTTNEGGENTNEGGENTNEGDGTTTGGETTGAGARRKRAAEDDENEKTVSKVFTVVGKRENKNDKTSSEQEAEPVDPVEECMARAEITAVVAILGAVVCVLLIVCFFLACVILKRKGKHTTTYDPTLFQPKPDRFQIPRAHVNESYEMM